MITWFKMSPSELRLLACFFNLMYTFVRVAEGCMDMKARKEALSTWQITKNKFWVKVEL